MLACLQKSHILFLFFIEAVAKSQWNKIKENFSKFKQRRERMSRSRAGNEKLPECKFFHELLFLNSAGEPQESHSSFININETSVTKPFEETALTSESYPRDLNFKVPPESKREQDD